MKTSLQDLLKDIELHPSAEKLARKYIREFQLALFTDAIAAAGKDKFILYSHMEDACRATYEKRYQKGLKKQWANALGGACLGAFVPGVFTELAQRNDVMLFIFIVLGLFGAALLTWSFSFKR